MKAPQHVTWLTIMIALLALIASAAGLLWTGAATTYTFVSLHGDPVPIYGHGIYASDSVFKSGVTRGTDLVTIALAVPLLIVSLARYRRGSTRGALLLAGTLTYFLYVYATNAMSVAYNPLFLLYVALFSMSFFAWFLMMSAIEPIASGYSQQLPYRGIGAFLAVCGLLTSYVWLEPIVTTLARGAYPDLLDQYTTMVTEALDLALIVPGCFVAGVMLFRRNPQGIRVAVPLLVLLLLIGPAVAAMTYFQLADGIVFTTPQIVGPIGGFLVVGLIDIWVLAIVLRAAPAPASSEQKQTKHLIPTYSHRQ